MDLNIFDDIKKDIFNVIKKLSIKELEEVLMIAIDNYYNKIPLISDDEYDIIYDYLYYKDPKNKLLKQIGTNKKRKDDVKLPYFLGSMDKIRPYVENEVKKFKKFKLQFKKPYVMSEKLDGISALLVYTFDGNINMYTRGSATEGANITKIVKYLKHIPTFKKVKEYALSNKVSGVKNYMAFRGELILSKETFNNKWSSKYKNIRNTVGGLVNSKNINPKLARDTRFVCYNILDPNYKINDQYKIIKEIGLECVHNKTVDKLDLKYLDKYLKKRKEKSKYDIDGIIVTNDIKHTLNTDGNPEFAFAFKNINTKVTTNVLNIEWNVSKDGKIKPVIIIEKINIGGVDINRVTGNNARFIKENNIGKDTVLEIIRSGDVIPKVNKIIKGTVSLFPDMDYKWDKNNVEILIKENNREMEIKNIYYFFSQLKAKGLGEKIIEKLYDNNFNTIFKIFNMKKDDIIDLEGIKDKSADNIIKAVENSVKNKTLADIMNASNKLGSGMGIERLSLITSAYPNILSNKWLKKEFIEKIKKIDGFDDITASLFVNNFNKFIIFYNDIKKFIKLKTKVVKKNGKYKDMKVVISGFRDDKVKEYIEKEGGIITNSISKNTDLVVIKDKSVNDTQKVIKAKELGIKIVLKDNI